MIFNEQLVIIGYKVADDVENELGYKIVLANFKLKINDLLNDLEIFYLVWLPVHELGDHVCEFEIGKWLIYVERVARAHQVFEFTLQNVLSKINKRVFDLMVLIMISKVVFVFNDFLFH